MASSRSRPIALLCLIVGSLLGPWTPALAALGQDAELEDLLQEERDEAAILSRRGEYRKARKILQQHLEDEPEDAASGALLARVRLSAGDFDRAQERALEVLGGPGQASAKRAAAEVLCDLWIELGQGAQAVAMFEGDSPTLSDQDFSGALRHGLALESLGLRGQAQAVWGQVLRISGVQAAQDWPSLLAKGRIEQRLGKLVPASRSVTAADRAAIKAGGPEPDILAALGALYFESEREVNLSGKRSAAKLFRDALALHPSHEEALLGLYDLHRYNRRRQSQSPESFLVELLAGRPGSVAGLLGRAGSDLSDGRLKAARASLALLAEKAPGRRERVTMDAALAWVEHRREACLESLDGLLADAPKDSVPERQVGRILIELYRFSEAIPFLERATQRNPADYQALQLYAGALANVGDETRALEVLRAAVTAAGGRKDAKRDNLKLVLERMAAHHVREDYGELVFSWQPDAAEVLRTYLVPFYSQAREELAQRYGFTPGPTTIEVFRNHEDFSVRSVGFAGFPALGVCFGSVVTAVSPLSGMRGKFSWARTSFHEFSHVVHLGLSHNRCPRWITEGLATWEEVRRSPSWTRNMRRELIDSRAGDDLIPVRQLNRAFRGPRILFGYYQGGLLCEMLIAEHGFPPMIRLLEAFDDGLDLDAAFQSTFGQSPEQVDRAFEAFVDKRIAGLAIEPRWPRRKLTRLRLSMPRELPSDEAGLERWREGWTTIAWGRWQEGQKLDAQEALRKAGLVGGLDTRGLFLRGEMALSDGDGPTAEGYWGQAVDAGGRDFRAMIGLGSLALGRGDSERAEELFLAAEQSFPGYDEPRLSAELKLAELYKVLGRADDSMLARERWLRWNAGEYGQRAEVATWRQGRGEFLEAEGWWSEAAEVDLFRRDLHLAWGQCLLELERFEEAEREFRVARLVPADLDPDHWELVEGAPAINLAGLSDAEKLALDRGMVRGVPLDKVGMAELMVLEAQCCLAQDRPAEAGVLVERALSLDPGNKAAEELLPGR